MSIDPLKTALAIVAVTAGVTAASAAEPTIPAFEMATVAETAGARLTNSRCKDGRCVLRGGTGEEHTLGIPAPCGFVRTSAANPPQTYAYEGVGSVFVVAGPPAPASAYSADSGVEPSFACSNEGQPIFLHEGRLATGPAKMVPLGFCHLLGFDEKNYYGFAHRKNSAWATVVSSWSPLEPPRISGDLAKLRDRLGPDGARNG